MSLPLALSSADDFANDASNRLFVRRCWLQVCSQLARLTVDGWRYVTDPTHRNNSLRALRLQQRRGVTTPSVRDDPVNLHLDRQTLHELCRTAKIAQYAAAHSLAETLDQRGDEALGCLRTHPRPRKRIGDDVVMECVVCLSVCARSVCQTPCENVCKQFCLNPNCTVEFHDSPLSTTSKAD